MRTASGDASRRRRIPARRERCAGSVDGRGLAPVALHAALHSGGGEPDARVELLRHLAGTTGASHADVTDALSQLLPHVVDRLTPDGTVPEQGIGAGADDLLKQLGLAPG